MPAVVADAAKALASAQNPNTDSLMMEGGSRGAGLSCTQTCKRRALVGRRLQKQPTGHRRNEPNELYGTFGPLETRPDEAEAH